MFGLNEKEIQSLKDGKWEIHCLSMKLARLDGARTYRGSGFIKQDENGQLVFNLYDSEYQHGNKSFWDGVTSSNLQAGQIFPKNQAFVLRCIDTEGNTWRSLPTFDIDMDCALEKGIVARGTVYELQRDDDLKKWRDRQNQNNKKQRRALYYRPIYHFHIFDNIGSFPCNAKISSETKVAKRKHSTSWSLCVARFDSCGYHFQIENQDGRIKYFVESIAQRRHLQINADMRFIEALQFVLGRPLRWQVLQIAFGDTEHIRIRSKIKDLRSRALPPIALSIHHHFDEVWRLFGNYLKYIKCFKDAEWHPVSSRLFTVQQAQAYLWNTRMLTVGVEVEGLLKDEYHMKKKCERSLKRLAVSSIVRQQDITAWRQIRQSAAHGMRGETEFSQENCQKLFRVLVLFYHLIFSRIGYKGKYTDYGEFGFPAKNYPS